MMEEQTKNIITREWVEKELRFYNAADIRSRLVVGGSFLLALAPLTVGIIFGILSFSVALPLKIAFCIFLGILMNYPAWIVLFSLCVSIAERKLLLNGEFDITVRELLHKKETLYRRHLKTCLRFEDFKDVAVADTQFQLASKGELFYLIHYRTRKSVKLLYSCKMYEYKES
jgi:hypothetical protein